MKDWRTEKKLYEIHEISKKSVEIYRMLATGNEVSAWCKMKNEFYGFVPGLGGDKSYSCWAATVNY